MALNKIVKLLDNLTRDEMLRLISIVSERLLETAPDPDAEPGDDDERSRRYLPRLPQMIEWGVLVISGVQRPDYAHQRLGEAGHGLEVG